MENEIKKILNDYVNMADGLYNILKELNLLNESYTLDFLDKLNEISVR